ncbi:MAG: UDP-4-amino-4,6-dideoxy-N-acetyl-beta-L-altrosamine N-acetyltransferase [Clostridia bacterium]
MAIREDYLLREMEESDLELVLHWRNSERIRASMYTDKIISWEDHCAWFSRMRENNGIDYRIFEYLGRPIGLVNFTGIDRENRKCHWGFYLGETDVPRGIGTVMGYLGLEYAFESLLLRKICGEAFSFNQASINYHKRLGFREEGLFVKHILKSGNYEDVVSFALFQDEWIKIKGDLEKMVFREGSSV